MSTTLALTGVDITLGARTLVTGLDLVLGDGDVTALVGPNGSGKSTLMRSVLGELPLGSGSMRLSPGSATIGWLPQVPPDAAETLLEHARRRTGVAAADLALQASADQLAAGVEGAEERYSTAWERWLSLGAADLEDRLPEVAAQVGLDVAVDRPLGSLSGGQAARASLVVVLLSRYEVLLLDEPTNDLDARGLALVTDFVMAHDGPVLVASHDRDFLDSVATRVVELDLPQQRIGHYSGGYTDFVAARTLARRQAREAFEAYAGERDTLIAQARRRDDWAAQGRQAVKRGDEPDKHLRERDKARADRQSAKAARIKRSAERLEVVEQPRKEWQLRYTLSSGPDPAEVVATLSGARVDRGDFRLGPVDLTVGRGDRVAVSGDNGSGKTTLLRCLWGDLPLSEGRASLGTRVTLGVLDQQRRLFDTDEPVLDVVRDALDGRESAEVRTLLAKFGLGSDHVTRPGRTLSHGERTRALLAVFGARAVNVLVLDEPTNHLDAPAIEQLESALADYAGTIVVVSHDVRFLSALGITRRWHLENGRVRDA
ncbi:ATPase component of ABC transporters with duplicated ATPase domain [metagenome]|uniref:ATPase component of ABC transporters with duplicated ATPase domain n=1 Tax=metagenome TaxID=256318 RepID=A0A2P2C3C5_9ZZZZ